VIAEIVPLTIIYISVDLVRARMWAAKRKDSTDAVLQGVVKPVSGAYSLRSSASPFMSTGDEQPDPMVVKFVLFKTLPDPEPVVVRREHQLLHLVLTLGGLIRVLVKLSLTAGIEEVLWNFSPFEDDRRIALQDNPRFYLDLPTSLDAYTDKFKRHPLENLELRPNATVYVLTDQPRRLFLEARQETRIFGNVFMLKDVMIFKGL
jgi:hypothetical protein